MCEARRALCASAIALLGFARSLAGQTDVIMTGVLADSSLVAPLLQMRRIAADGTIWRAGLAGWTVSCGWERPRMNGQRLAVELALTPFRARASDLIYDRGQRDHEAEYEASSADLRLTYSIRQSARSHSSAALVLLQNQVGHVDSRTSLMWRNPYAGLRVEQGYRKVRSEDPLSGQMLGSEVKVSGELFTGDRAWWRSRLNQRGAIRRGAYRIGEDLSLFGGGSLDTVSAFLVGGPWQGDDVTALHGFRYAEFRLERGAVANLWADRELGRAARLALRGSALAGPGVRAAGLAVDISGRWHGARWSGGIGFPWQRDAVATEATAYLNVAAGLFR